MIAGLQKMSLLDFPGKVACTVFLQGCNWRCPFCHNSELITGPADAPVSTEAFLRFLSGRKGLLDGVCISGGEPTLHAALPSLAREIKAMGFAVKLDTNGTRPDMLKQLVSQNLVDFVAMDIKNGPSFYAETIGLENAVLSPVEESIQYLVSGNLPYEFRTTVVCPLHTDKSMLEMGRWLASLVPGKKPERLFLQGFVDRDTVLFSGLSCPDDETLARYCALLSPFVGQVSVRGKH